MSDNDFTKVELQQALNAANSAAEQGNEEASEAAEQLKEKIKNGEYSDASGAVTKEGKQPNPKINKFTEGVRSFVGGLTFSYADEIEAALRSGSINSDEYKMLRDRLRNQQTQFGEENPYLKTGLEVGGGLMMPGGAAKIGLTKALGGATKYLPNAVKGSLGKGAGYGAAYGTGAAEEQEDMLTSGALGSVLGLAPTALVKGVGNVTAPVIDKGVKALQAKGVKLTPGQTLGGVTNFLEQQAGKVLPNVRNRRNEALQGFTRSVGDDILKPFNVKVPKSMENDPSAISTFAQKKAGEFYEKLLPKLSLKKTAAFTKELDNAIPKDVMKSLNPEVQKILKQEIGNAKELIGKKGLQGQGVKILDDTVDALEDYYKISAKNPAEKLAGIHYGKIAEVVKSQLKKQNPKHAKDLKNLDAAYSNMATFQSTLAIGGNALKDSFTPAQLVRAATSKPNLSKPSRRILKADPSLSTMGKTGKDAYSVLSDTLPDSGTTGGLITTIAATGGLGHYTGKTGDIAGVAKALTIPAAIALLYTKPGQAMAAKMLNSGQTRKQVADFFTKNASKAGLISAQQGTGFLSSPN